MRSILLGAVLLLAGGCAKTVVGSVNPVPKDAATTCSAHCNDMGLQLSSVVVMASNVGCVCSRAGAAPDASAAGGMAALMQQEEEARRQSSSAQPTTSKPR